MAKPLCPTCEKRVHVIQKIVKKRTKRILLTICSKCKWNFDIEDFENDSKPATEI